MSATTKSYDHAAKNRERVAKLYLVAQVYEQAFTNADFIFRMQPENVQGFAIVSEFEFEDKSSPQSMLHWLLVGPPIVTHTPLLRRLFNDEQEWTQVNFWLRQDGEIVFNTGKGPEGNTRKTKAYDLTTCTQRELELLMQGLKNVIPQLQRPSRSPLTT